MNKKNTPSTNLHPVRPDAVKEFIDSIGRKLLISVQFKVFNDRLDIAAITIQTTDLHSPISRRLLNEIPLGELFRDELAAEEKHLKRLLSSRTKTAHQGRQHSDDDLRVVADMYNAAFQSRVPVQRAVADALGISVSTAAKRIMAARSRGFITSNQRDE